MCKFKIKSQHNDRNPDITKASGAYLHIRDDVIIMSDEADEESRLQLRGEVFDVPPLEEPLFKYRVFAGGEKGGIVRLQEVGVEMFLIREILLSAMNV